MKKIWKISNQINSTDLEIQPLECQDIFIQDFSIQKEKLMTSFLNKKSLESSNILRHSVPHFVEKAAFSKNLFKIDPKELLIEYSKIHELKLIQRNSFAFLSVTFRRNKTWVKSPRKFLNFAHYFLNIRTHDQIDRQPVWKNCR